MEGEQRLSRRKLLKRAVAFGIVLVAVDSFGIEPNWIDVRRITVPIKDLPPEFEGYRIALFSDVHYPKRIQKAHVQRVCALANAFDPHLVLIPGDLFDHRVEEGSMNLKELFDTLKAPDGLFTCRGNHDHCIGVDQWRAIVENDTPLTFLENEHRIIRRGEAAIALGAVGDLYFGRVDPIRAFDGVPESMTRILMSHNPDVAEDQVWKTRIDLQVSGHTHGGEIRVPFGPAPFLPSKYGQKFRSGLVEGKSHRVYVTRGICSPRGVRLFCRPEVTYLTLRAA